MIQSNNTTAEMPKLKVVTTVTTTEQKELELDIPYFCKYEHNFYKVQSEKKVVEVYSYGSLHMITIQQLSFCSSKVLKAERITEADFEAALDEVADKIYEPVEESVTLTNERDPNEEIDEILERRAS
jgi:hypothetical protein